jgi:uncharacterized iron-regulated membrane protein
MRQWHRLGGILVALPFLVVIVTGILLQLKKQVPWVQPPSQRGSEGAPAIGFDALLAAVRAVPEARVAGWDDISRIDVQPGRGMAKVQTRGHWEVQVDLGTGAVLQSTYRRSDLIEQMHDGSFFHEYAKLGVFLPVALVLLVLWVSGVYLWLLPWRVRRERTRRPDLRV